MKREQTGMSFELPRSRLIANANTMAIAAENHLQAKQAPTKQVQEVAENLQLHLAKKSAYGMKASYAAHVVQVIDTQVMDYFEQFVAFDRALREQPRHALDQADVEGFNQEIRQGHANTLLTVRGQLANQIEGVVAESVDPKPPNKPVQVIVQKPPFWGLFGGREVTQMVYDDD